MRMLRIAALAATMVFGAGIIGSQAAELSLNEPVSARSMHHVHWSHHAYWWHGFYYPPYGYWLRPYSSWNWHHWGWHSYAWWE